MNGFPGLNKNNGLLGPSSCDVATTKNVYAEERQIASVNTTDQRAQEPVSTDSNLVLPSIGLEKRDFSVLDVPRPLVGGAAAIKPAAETRTPSPAYHSVVAPSPFSAGKSTFSLLNLRRPAVHRPLFLMSGTFQGSRW